jgi:cobalt-zinc-cadmium efflux system protein
VSRDVRLRLALVLNLAIVIVQVIAGFAAGSLGLLADAGHNVADLVAVVFALIAVRLVRRPPTPARSFGMHRSTILAAQANAAGLLVATALIVYEAVGRLLHPHTVESGVVVVVALFALLGNGFSAWIVRERHGHDLNMRAVMAHFVADALGSAGVAVAGAVMLITGDTAWLDPAVSLIISALIAWQAWQLLRATADVLLESTPEGLDVDELAAAIAAVAGVDSVHDLHVWSLSSDVRALSAHIVVSGHPTLEEAQAVGVAVKDHIGPRFAIAHATIELECEHCADDRDADACAMPQVEIHAGHDLHHH